MRSKGDLTFFGLDGKLFLQLALEVYGFTPHGGLAIVALFTIV